ncbi:MAG: SPOR domain-containing protein [Rubellimicrobium sp.]|nr:SPOR domain-containing protein [Rubellimicrobium sp.]
MTHPRQDRPRRHPQPEVRAAPLGARVAALTRMAGAAASIGLVLGVGVWGYRLMMRDVTGIPVVRAMAGPMRIAPEDPGGAIADHTGLAVNAIAAVGAAAAPEDMLTLAPAADALLPEDLEAAGQDPGPGAGGAAAEAAIAPGAEGGTMSAEDVLALADMIAAGVDPLEPLAQADGGTAPAAATAAAAAAPVVVIPADVPGVAVSLRPHPRPAQAAALAAAAVAPAVAPALPAVTTGSIPAGSTLVQFGAFETAQLAAEEWDRLHARFGSFLGPLDRVIQEAASGGRVFYRLRAVGFADMAEARRLCTALIAEGVDCIPTVEG